MASLSGEIVIEYKRTQVIQPQSGKSKEARVKECVAVLKKITGELGIPYHEPEVQEMKEVFDEYIKTGKKYNNTISFRRFGRIAHLILPDRAEKEVEVTLKAIPGWRPGSVISRYNK